MSFFVTVWYRGGGVACARQSPWQPVLKLDLFCRFEPSLWHNIRLASVFPQAGQGLAYYDPQIALHSHGEIDTVTPGAGAQRQQLQQDSG